MGRKFEYLRLSKMGVPCGPRFGTMQEGPFGYATEIITIFSGGEMMRSKSIFVLVIVTVFSLNSYAATVNSTWVGGFPEDTSWGQASNWSPAIVPDNNPTNTFNVKIDSNGDDEIEIGLQQSRMINQLDCYGNVGLETWTGNWAQLTLVEPNGLTNHGSLWIDEIEIHGNLTNTNGAWLELCEVEIEGYLYNLQGGVIEAEGENDVWRDLRNDGTLTIIHASDLLCDSNLYNNGQLNLYCGEFGVDGILDNNSTGVIRGFGIVYAEQLLQNKGEICAYGGSLAINVWNGAILNTGVLVNRPLSSLHIKAEEDVNNQGTIEVNTGGGVAFDCNVVNKSGAIINLLGGTLAATNITQSNGAAFEGFGNITGDILIETGGIITLTGPTNIIGDVTVSAGATLQISDGQTLITGQTTNNGTIELIGGTVIFQGGYTGGGTIPVTAGTDRNHFDINSDGIADFRDFAGFAESWLWQASWY